MSNTKLTLAVGLAAAALALFLTNTVGGVAVLQAGLATPLVISAVVLGVAAFVVSLRQRSYVLAGLLVAAGVVGMIPPIIATGYFAVIVFPGPIIGVFFGLAILGLGVAKGIGSARAVTAIMS
jgi:hypothetical protein